MTDNVAKNQSLSNNQSSQSETESKIQPNLPTQPPAIIRTLPLILLTVAFGIWGFTARIPVKVVGSSILIVPRSSVDFQTRGAGRVVELKVEVGDKVKKRQVLAILESNELKEQILNKEQELAKYESENIAITEIERQRSLLKVESITRQQEAIPLSIQASKQQIESNKQEQLAIIRQRETYKQRLAQIDEIDKLISQRFEAYNGLVSEGAVAPLYGSRIQAEDVLQKNLNEKTQLKAKLDDLTAKDQQLTAQNESLQAQNQNLQAQLENLASKKAEISLDDLQSDNQRQNNIDNLKRDIDNLKVKLKNETEVISEYEGEISEISVNIGQFISTGTSLGKLKVDSDRDSEEIVLAFFTPENADRIYPDMTVEVTPNLLTERRFGGVRERYGGIKGKITAVSPETITTNEVTSLVGNPQLAESLMSNPVPYSAPDPGEAKNLPVVQVEIALERNPDNVTGYQWESGKEPNNPIPQGAIGEARVTVEERSPVNYLVPLFRWITGIYSNKN